MRNAFQPLKRQFYVAHKLDFQDTSPRKSEPSDSPKKLHNSDFNLRKPSIPAPRSILSTKEETTTFFNNDITQNTQNNIFQDVNQAERKKYIDYNIGPRYDAEGNIVRWSILGKPEQFSRGQAQRKKGNQAGSQQQNVLKKVQSKKEPQSRRRKVSIREEIEESNKPLRTGATLNHQQSTSSDIRLQTANSQKVQGQKGVSKKHRNDYKLIPKQELLNYMQNVRRRVESNDRDEKQQVSELAINVRNQMSREGRTIERFEDQIEVWDDQRNILSSHCNRESRTALISRTEGYRQRVENVSGVEVTKSDQEKYSNRFWYLRLRSYQTKSSSAANLIKEIPMPKLQKHEGLYHRPQFDLTTSVNHRDIPRLQSRLQNRFVHDKDNEQLFKSQEFIMADIFSGFQTKIVDNPSQQIEIVRKPILCKDSSAPLFSNKFHSLFESRMMEHPEKLRSKKAQINESETDRLMLEGQSVFYKELKHLQNDGAPMMAQYQKLSIDKDPDPNNEEPIAKGEQIIVEQWNMRTLSKTGEHFYPKFINGKKQ